jgi:hypothetical protein
MNSKDLARFESKYIPEPNSGCWLWIGPLTRKYDVDGNIIRRIKAGLAWKMERP